MYRVKVVKLDDKITLSNLLDCKYEIRYFEDFISMIQKLFWNVKS